MISLLKYMHLKKKAMQWKGMTTNFSGYAFFIMDYFAEVYSNHVHLEQLQ